MSVQLLGCIRRRLSGVRLRIQVATVLPGPGLIAHLESLPIRSFPQPAPAGIDSAITS